METIDLDGVQLRFVKLTLSDEDDWKDWLRGRIMLDAKKDADLLELQGKERAEFLNTASRECAVGKCGLVTQFGLEHAMTPEGIVKILRMASKQHHPSPGIDDATLHRLLTEKTEDVQRVLYAILPGNLQKKATAGPKAGQPGTR